MTMTMLIMMMTMMTIPFVSSLLSGQATYKVFPRDGSAQTHCSAVLMRMEEVDQTYPTVKA